MALALASVASHADVVPVVSAKCHISTLSKSEIVDIFLRKRSRFPDGDPAVPIDQAEGSAARPKSLVATNPDAINYLDRTLIDASVTIVSVR